MNNLAKQLNDKIVANNSNVYDMLSELGKNLFYPKGILSQSAEAGKKATRFNATIGIATEGSVPMHFKHIQEHLDYDPKDIYPYAPPSGKQPLREAWREKQLKDNPSLQGKSFGMPIAINALTHGLSIVADLFVNEGDTIITPDKYWGNYNLVFNTRRGGNVVTFELFDENRKFNVAALKRKLAATKRSWESNCSIKLPE